MSITALIPVRLGLFDRPARKHRAPDEIERLRFLLDGANLCIKGLQVQLDDQDRKHAAAIARIDEQHDAEVRQLQGELADAERRLDVRTLAEAAAAQTQEIPVIQVMTLQEAPFATSNPGRVRPSWAVQDEPRPTH